MTTRPVGTRPRTARQPLTLTDAWTGKPNLAACIRAKRTDLLTPLLEAVPTLSLDLPNARLTGIDALTLATWLEACRVPIRLDLRNNDLRDDGAKALATLLLQTQVQMTSLDLSCNQITDEGVRAIASALARNPHLRRLSLVNCSFDPQTADALADALNINATLQRLNLFNCEAPPLALDRIAEAVRDSKSLRSVDAGSWGDSARDIDWAGMLKRNAHLRRLNLYGNPLTPAGVIALAGALATNTTLTTLKMRGIDITPEGLDALAHALERNHALLLLEISGEKHDRTASRIREYLRRNTADPFQARFLLQWTLKSLGPQFDVPCDLAKPIIEYMLRLEESAGKRTENPLVKLSRTAL